MVGAAVVHAQSVTYQVTFTGHWTTTATPGGVPTGAHFSPLIGAVHNDQVTFWQSGGTASAGIESMAEVGGTSTLKSEINASSHALSVIERSGTIGETATATVDITVSPTHPLVTLVTMIAPSPDWFVGVTGLSLRDSSDNWLASQTVELFPYDAGTEEGTEFSLTNAATDPQGSIASIKGMGKFSNEPIATLTFTLLAAPVITTASALEVDEGQTTVTTLTATDTDTAQADLTWTIPAGSAGGADAAQFTLTSAGVLTFTTAPDYEAPADTDGDGTYEVTVQVSDGTTAVTADLRVTLLNVTELTTLSGPMTVTFAENGWGRVASFTASSAADRDAITWTLGGDDAAHFSLDTPAGALRFVLAPVAPAIFSEPPDFETPVDSDTDNIYELTVQASAGTESTAPVAVTVTVTDVDEAGALSLSSSRPESGTELTATLTDLDGVTTGTAVWQWERSTGRNAWAEIDGATAAAYTPGAADTNTFLRVTATYEDEHGTGKTVSEVAPNVVTGPLLTGLTAATEDSRAVTARGLYPAFDPQTLHYGIGCNSTDTMVLTVSAAADARVAVDGVQAARAPEAVSVAVTADSDVAIRVTEAGGAATTYVVHCLADVFFTIETHAYPGTDVFEDLLLLNHNDYFTLMDRNGVPRFRRYFLHLGRFASSLYRVGNAGAWRYGLPRRGRYTILDEDFEIVDDNAKVALPLTMTNRHDFQILEDGNYLLMSYEPATRDFSAIDLPYLDGANVSSVAVLDSAFQVVTPEGSAVFTWKSWGNMAIEDCVQHNFPLTLSTDPGMREPAEGYAHINGVHVVDGVLVASMRGCSKVLGIDVEPGATQGDVLWRMGRTNLSDAEWAARDIGPPPLDFINDPEGEFCGQHTARVLPNGNVFLFDNGAACAIDPWTFEVLGREGDDFSRAVEYALDLENHEAVFVRDHSQRGERAHVGHSTGNVNALDNGDWLVSWGRSRSATVLFPDNEMVTVVDPATGQEKLGLRFRELPSDVRDRHINATVVPAEALAPQPEPLTAELPSSSATSIFHIGAADAPQVVVAFNRPVVDFDATSPSLSVTGGTVASVSAHVVAGAPAHAYLVTFTPAGDGPLTFTLVADQACASGGICTADGTLLSEVPAEQVIPGPLVVSFGAASGDVAEGNSHTVPVILARNGRTDALEIELAVQGGTATLDTDYGVPARVPFGAADTVQTVFVVAHADTVVEGAETLVLGIVAPALPAGVQVGSTPTTTVTIADGTAATIDFSSSSPEVAEGNAVQLTFRARLASSPATPATFTTDQTLTLDLSGSATPGVDFTISAGGSPLSAPYTLPLLAGESTVTATLTAVDDLAQEGAETITVRGEHAGSALGPQTLTIPASDQPVPTVTIARTQGAVTEGEELGFTLSRDGVPTAALPVSVSVSESGAMLPPAPPPTTVTFLAGASSAPLRVPTDDDAIVEEPSTVTVAIFAGSGYEPGIPSSASVVVRDNDTATFRVSATPATVMEGRSSAVPVTVAIIEPDVTFAADQPLSLHLGGSATRDSDYTVASDRLTLPAGQREVTTTLTLLDDTVDEPEETIELTATHAGHVTAAAVVQIADNDPPRVSITAGRAREDEAAVEFPVRLSTADAQTVSVLATTTDGTARADADYTAVVDELLTFPPGETVQRLTIVVHDDSVVETDETFTVMLSAPQNATLAADATRATGTIENDDGRRTTGGSGGGGGGGGGGGAPACTQDDVHGNSAAQATAMALATPTAGAICPAADVDYLTVPAPGPGLLFVDTFGGVNLRGTLWQAGAVLVSGPTSGSQQDDRLGARVQAGPVVVALQGQGGATGAYDVEVTFVQGYLENPGADSFQSGVGVLSGWVCDAEVVEVALNGVPQEAAYGTERRDTAGVCGDVDNGFGLLFNWNLLGDGAHAVVALVDGVELGRATVTVTTLGEEFVRGVAGECEAEDFPLLGERVTLVWQQNNQNFVITGGSRPAAPTPGRSSGLTGYLENPGPNSFQSGVGVLSGWVCEADMVEIAIGNIGRQVAAYGTERRDTAGVCGDTDNGFGLLFNWNLLGEGAHEVVAYVDGVELGRATVQVTTLGEEFLRGAEGECTVADFPSPGETVTLEWQQNQQNFVITALE